jgi:hypothetical protein
MAIFINTRLDTAAAARDAKVAAALDLFSEARETYDPTLNGADNMPLFTATVAPFVRYDAKGRASLDLAALKNAAAL